MALYAWRVTVGTTPVDPFDTEDTPEQVQLLLMAGRHVGVMWRVTTTDGEVLVGGAGVDDAAGFPWSQADGPFPLTTNNRPGFVTETGEVEVAMLVDAGS